MQNSTQQRPLLPRNRNWATVVATNDRSASINPTSWRNTDVIAKYLTSRRFRLLSAQSLWKHVMTSHTGTHRRCGTYPGVLVSAWCSCFHTHILAAWFTSSTPRRGNRGPWAFPTRIHKKPSHSAQGRLHAMFSILNPHQKHKRRKVKHTRLKRAIL